VSLEETLEIFLITYNRKKHLQKTFDQIFAENSPIKDLQITIIDNNSTDGTFELIQEYTSKFPNVRHIVNNRNIGGNANIAKAFENAKKEYFWIICDNDYYCWDDWAEVEKAIEENADAIMVSNFNWPEQDIAHAFIQATFVPGVIYKTSNITETVMENIEFNIANQFPHSALFASLINTHKKIVAVKNGIVIIGENESNAFVRGNNVSELSYLRTKMSWYIGFANTLHLIKNSDIRDYIASHRVNSPALNSCFVINQYRKSLYSLFSIFYVLGPLQRILFLLKLLAVSLSCCIIQILPSYSRDAQMNYFKAIHIKLFGFIRIKLPKKAIKRKIVESNIIQVPVIGKEKEK